MATAIAYEIRRKAPREFSRPEIKSQAELSVQMRLEKLYGRKGQDKISQNQYI